MGARWAYSAAFGSQEAARANFPSIAGVQELVQIARAALGNYIFDLLVHHVFITWQIVPGTKHADRGGEARPMLHMREQKGVGRPRMMRIVDNQVGFCN